jgi:hypothetical protein
MRRGWKRVAEYADNPAFASEAISNAIIPALEEDCRSEIVPDFLDAISRVFRDQESSLFKDQLGPELDTLRDSAGCGIGRVVLEHAIHLVEGGRTGVDGLVEATANALADRAARGGRQVEEHYCRQSSSPRAQKVRARIEKSIADAPINSLARQILKLDSRPSSPPKLRQEGLDDGVRL